MRELRDEQTAADAQASAEAEGYAGKKMLCPAGAEGGAAGISAEA